jgi:hypothetical protein
VLLLLFSGRTHIHVLDCEVGLRSSSAAPFRRFSTAFCARLIGVRAPTAHETIRIVYARR